MLEKVDQLSLDIANIIIYTNSNSLQSFLKKRLKERFNIARNLTKYASKASELKEIKNETFTPPFGGGTWFLDIQADKLSLSDLGKSLNNVSNAAVCVYWFTNYAQFKKVCELEVVKRQGMYCFTMYTGKLYPEDITYMHEKMLPVEKRLPKKLLDYLKKNYTYDVDAVCKVFQSISQGEEIKSTRDIINKVGMGGNTVDSFVIKLLTTNPKTEKGLKSSFEKAVVLLNDLSYSYEYRTIKNYMRSTLKTIIDIKQLQIMGLYTENLKNIPENVYDETKIQRMKRYDRVILNELNLGRVINLLLCIDKYDSFDTELSLIEGINSYLIWIYHKNMNNPESKEVSPRFKWR